VLIPGVDFGAFRVGVDRLETNTELSDLRQIPFFCTFPDPADAANVSFIELPTIMQYLQSIREKFERYLAGSDVFGVLKQLKDEVRAIGIEQS
jgi:hypothetical protein